MQLSQERLVSGNSGFLYSKREVALRDGTAGRAHLQCHTTRLTQWRGPGA